VERAESVGHKLIAQSKLDALDRSQAMIKFNLDGAVILANQNFLNLMGYPLA
jgi:methyl-accepting chemotaxis protein